MSKLPVIATSIATFSLFFIFSNVTAQNGSVRSLSKIEGSFGGLGFGYEAKLSSKWTIDFNAGVGGHYEIYKHDFEYIFAGARYEVPAAYFSVNPRFYYNFSKRVRNGKNTINNSGNYIGIKIKHVRELNNDGDATLTNVHWGMQRSFGKKHQWLFDARYGLGYGGMKYGDEAFYPAIDAKFAYILSKK